MAVSRPVVEGTANSLNNAVSSFPSAGEIHQGLSQVREAIEMLSIYYNTSQGAKRRADLQQIVEGIDRISSIDNLISCLQSSGKVTYSEDSVRECTARYESGGTI